MRAWIVAAASTAGLLLTVAPSGAVEPAERGLGFRLERSDVGPKRVLFAGPRRARLRFSFEADRRTDLRIIVSSVRKARTVASWRLRDARPGRRLTRRWNGIDRRGRAARDGRYEFRVGARGRPLRFAGRFRLRGHAFPVDGPHSARGAVGEFGAARSGGRTHEGFDIVAGCGTPLVASRGGRVRKVGFDPRLYGHYALIRGRKSDERYFYSHLVEAASVRRGERVRTGQRIGRVGRTGNAASTPCHLHFELHRDGRPVDPESELRRWDRWS